MGFDYLDGEVCSFCPNSNPACQCGGKCHGIFFGKKCVGEPQQPLGFAMALNMWDSTRCLEPNNLHRRPQPHPAIGLGFVTASVLNCRAHVFFSILQGFFHTHSWCKVVTSFVIFSMCVQYRVQLSWFVSSLLVL